MKRQNLQSFKFALIARRALRAFNKQVEAKAIQGAHGEEDEHERGESNIKWTDKGMFWTTVVLTVATAALYFEAANSGREIKEEFKIANTPYLQIAEVVDSIHPGERPIISYQLQDLGKVPCKIMWAQVADSISNQPGPQPPFGFAYNIFADKYAYLDISMYSTEGSPYRGQFTSGYTITDTVYKQLKWQTAFIYLYGIFDYVNQMSGEERIYDFSIKIYQSPPTAIQTFVNENSTREEYEMKHGSWLLK